MFPSFTVSPLDFEEWIACVFMGYRHILQALVASQTTTTGFLRKMLASADEVGYLKSVHDWTILRFSRTIEFDLSFVGIFSRGIVQSFSLTTLTQPIIYVRSSTTRTIEG